MKYNLYCITGIETYEVEAETELFARKKLADKLNCPLFNIDVVDAWAEYRQEVIKETMKMQAPLKQFLEETGIDDKFSYRYNKSKNELIIYSEEPGIWIGYRGEGVERLREILKAELDQEINVSIIKCFKQSRFKENTSYIPYLIELLMEENA